MQTGSRTWRIGELATLTGLTVRTLHHYEEVGLLVASARTEAGHRRYAPDDVRRLYRILALRRLGLPLGRIGAVLEGQECDPRELVRQHLAEGDEALAHYGRLRSTLAGILTALEAEQEPSAEDFIHAIEEMTMHSRYFTSEQQEQLAQRRDELGDEAIADYQRQWAELLDDVRAERDAGADPAGPRMQ